MRGDELKTLRHRLGLTQAALAERLGVHKLTVARWEWGTVPISEPAARLVRLLVKNEAPRKPRKGER